MKRNPTSLAKITPPSFSGVLARERLYSTLDHGRDCSVIWITGPPGSGKTTLVSEYLRHRDFNFLWYQVDQGDTDIATFFYYMRAAAHSDQIEPAEITSWSEDATEMTRRARNYLQGLLERFSALSVTQDHKEIPTTNQSERRVPTFSPGYMSNLSLFTQSYFRHLFTDFEVPFVLVFDSYDEVSAHCDFHEVIRCGISEIPDGGCMIIISRSEPPASMARLRASGLMQIINWQELQLTRSESDSIVNLRGLTMSDVAMSQLYDKTQGWAAGLALMIEYYRTEGVISEAPESSIPQVIFDYLAEEIFQKFDDATQEFLLCTAYLPNMTAQMAAELSSNKQSGKLLAKLARDHYFLTARQTIEEPVYEYHPLFREFLQTSDTKLNQGQQKIQRYRRAAKLLEHNGQLGDAVSVLLDVDQWDELAEVIKRHANEMIKNGRVETLAEWLESLPQEILKRNPWMMYWLGTSRFSFALRESRRLFEQAYTLFNEEKNKDVKGLLLSCSGVMNAILYELDDLALLDIWIQRFDKLIRSVDKPLDCNIEARVTSCMFMSLLLRQPDSKFIEYWVERAHRSAQVTEDLDLRMSVELYVAIAYMWAGQFLKTDEVMKSLNKPATSQKSSTLNLLMLKNVNSMYCMLTGNKVNGLQEMREGLELAKESGITLWNYQLVLNGIGCALGTGDLETADELIEEIESNKNSGRRHESCMFHYFLAWRAILAGDLLEALQHQKAASKLAIEIGSPFFEILSKLGMAQLLFDVGDNRKGEVQLLHVRYAARNIKNHLLEYVSFLIYAHIAINHGRKRSGLNSLRYALELGREYGYMNSLWWQPKLVAALCAVALEEGIETEYVRKLIKKHKLLPDTMSKTIDLWPWAFRIYTFDKCRLLREDEHIGIMTKLQKKPMELLKALIAFGARDVTEELLAESLWPGVDRDYSYRSLTTTIHRLRKLLGEDKVISVQDGRLGLNEQLRFK